MATPDELERRFTLLTAVVRYNELHTRDALAAVPDGAEAPEAAALAREEALELLALGEVITRKAGYGRQLAVRSARAAGASWSQIGAALGTSKQAAWEAHERWIDDQSEKHWYTGYEGLGGEDADRARSLAGRPPEVGDAAGS